ncbi:response regulator [Pseudoclavibacter soli]|uniref:response regulator n=1 Tax=Pseudoclavibacter soli TaxID=452623 RepID=UPI000419EA55|nr:response regulator transcription factor [Pseudoclavibacter soli]
MSEPNATPATSVLLVDDQDLFRAGLAMVIDAQPDFTVIGQASDGQAAIASVARLHPALVLMDIRMPGIDGIETTRRIIAHCAEPNVPPPRILVLTTLDTEDATRQALAAGATGFMLKNTEPEFLLAALRTLAAGMHVIATAQTVSLPEAPSAPPEFAELTDREREVFRAVSHGLNNREIAATLFLAEATVKTHVTAVLRKLGLRDRVQLVVYAYRHGLAD